jgi:hypothetical protein
MAVTRKGTLYEEVYSEVADAAILGKTFVEYTPNSSTALGVSPCRANVFPDGVAIFDQPTPGQQVSFQHGGMAHVAAGAAVVAGNLVMNDAILYVPGAGVRPAGKARTTAVNPGDIIEVLLFEAPGT